jgi:hypothetical protein
MGHSAPLRTAQWGAPVAPPLAMFYVSFRNQASTDLAGQPSDDNQRYAATIDQGG